ncbi:hypothetical protein [Halostella litorea]|uniref:hypothetical protein n=1 Tax=Halostella litorea TaxID=2528831 RepID=UPI001091E256|nr:hypothetical protein [Halostella litorea]
MTEHGDGAMVGRRRLLSLSGVGLVGGLSGCLSGSNDEGAERTAEEATVTVRIRNLDRVEREFEVVVRRAGRTTNSFTGELPANMAGSEEMVATVRATDEQHEVAVNTPAGQRGRTWDPLECGDFLVEATVENGEPAFEADCRSG